MRTETARAIQISELDPMRRHRLHDYETRLGRCLTPSEINEMGRLRTHGALEFSLWGPQERAILAIQQSELEKYLSDQNEAREPFNGVEFQHIVDNVVAKKVSFIVPDRSDVARLAKRSLANPDAA